MQVINLNPFAIVLAGFFVVVLIALYFARRGARQRHMEIHDALRERWGGGEGVGEEPALVDVYAMVEKGNGESGWGEVMPLSAKVVAKGEVPCAAWSMGYVRNELTEGAALLNALLSSNSERRPLPPPAPALHPHALYPASSSPLQSTRPPRFQWPFTSRRPRATEDPCPTPPVPAAEDGDVEVEVTVAIMMPSPSSLKKKKGGGEDDSELEYALGMVRVPWQGGFKEEEEDGRTARKAVVG
ncbi:hypothetical protein EIP91_002415 [Steccherinum ochraceum]|uniref:Uncharacterized protein n=1 Tax=Steccherinum ochraceum TaxID=92696 RepID=A0A4V2MWB5_9APHY|nr:hypothetical protein EIP91_002415 [Steccherinum ochraceum]